MILKWIDFFLTPTIHVYRSSRNKCMNVYINNISWMRAVNSTSHRHTEWLICFLMIWFLGESNLTIWHWLLPQTPPPQTRPSHPPRCGRRPAAWWWWPGALRTNGRLQCQTSSASKHQRSLSLHCSIRNRSRTATQCKTFHTRNHHSHSDSGGERGQRRNGGRTEVEEEEQRWKASVLEKNDYCCFFLISLYNEIICTEHTRANNRLNFVPGTIWNMHTILVMSATVVFDRFLDKYSGSSKSSSTSTWANYSSGLPTSVDEWWLTKRRTYGTCNSPLWDLIGCPPEHDNSPEASTPLHHNTLAAQVEGTWGLQR